MEKDWDLIFSSLNGTDTKNSQVLDTDFLMEPPLKMDLQWLYGATVLLAML